MILLHMYSSDLWLETPAIQPKRTYVYWYRLHTFEEHVETEDITKYPKVSIGTNPFKYRS